MDCGLTIMLGDISMKTFVEFRSNKFPPYEGEEDRLILGFGASVLRSILCTNWLRKELRLRG